MYTLLIADDEPLIRNGVKKIIDWESLGFSEIFLAEDGQEALDIIRKNHVDLVLTDIVMPFMDGLELTEILSREFPQIHVVILTGHEDFQYAQKSVGLGVKNYILKPIGAESLYKEMKEICEKLHIENSQRQYIQSMKNQLRQSLPVLQEQTLNKIVCSADRNLRLYLERAKSLQLDMSQAPYEIGVMDLDMENISGADYDLYLFASRNIVKECLGKEHYVFEDGKDRVVILFRCGTLEAESHDLIYDVLCIIQKSIYNTIRLKTTCALGTTAATLDELNQAYRNAKKALECKYSLGSNNVYDIEDLNYLERSFYYPQQELHHLTKSIMIGNTEEIERAVRSVFRDNGKDGDKVKDYGMRNYKNPEISLTSAAEFASVSTGYLSGLFKKEAGTNFVKYLTDVRMEKSMQLLRSTDMKTYEIAYETGFSNPHYFSVSFKKYTGMSPSEFRAKE